MKEKIEKIICESIKVKQELVKSQLEPIKKACEKIIDCLRGGGKLIVFGNGGSAADSQHLAAELIGRFQKDRDPIRAIALTTNTSILTAVANDYGWEASFRRQLEGLAEPKDIVVAISTSGNSKNVIEAASLARHNGIPTIGLLGNDGGKLKNSVDISIIVPSSKTPRIQEAHIVIIHIICEFLEEILSEKSATKKH